MLRRHFARFAYVLAAPVLAASTLPARAAPFYWTDWTAAQSGTTYLGTLSTATATVSVTYTNPQGIAFFQGSGGTDYWTDSAHVRDGATSPYTSPVVDNIPTGSDIVALQFAGNHTLQFSQAIANPVFSYVSLNGNGYAFLDQDFTILSFGDPSDGNPTIAGTGAAALRTKMSWTLATGTRNTNCWARASRTARSNSLARSTR